MEQAERQPHDDIRAECPKDSERDRRGQWGRTTTAKRRHVIFALRAALLAVVIGEYRVIGEQIVPFTK
jgi:hypothetical protein